MQYFAMLIFVSLAAALAATMLFKSRRRRFVERPDLPLDEWRRLYCTASRSSYFAADVVLEALSLEIGCKPGQIRPSDRIDTELRVPAIGEVSDSFELADERLQSLLAAQGYCIDDSRVFDECVTVSDVIARLATELEAHGISSESSQP